MAIGNFQLWPFEPNWSGEFRESLSWLTEILSSPTGAEQRRCKRLYPRRTFEFECAVHGTARQYMEQLIETNGGRNWYLPLFHQVYHTDAAVTASSNFLPCASANTGEIREGDILALIADDPLVNELVEVDIVGSTGITLTTPMTKAWKKATAFYPVRLARFTDQPEHNRRSDSVVTTQVRFRVMQANNDVFVDVDTDEAGPMIMNGLIVNSYHDEIGRGGYFHEDSGTSEGQFIFIYAALLAAQTLAGGTVAERVASDYYLNLAKSMLDAIGTGAYTGPMLRQPVPTDPDTITLMHWLYAARGDVPEQEIVYTYEAPVVAGKLTIPFNANGNRVIRVFQIYPTTSALLYESPYSPAFDTTTPAEETQIEITSWTQSGDTTIINVPSGAPSLTSWKIVYAYAERSSIAMGEGYEAFPSWTRIASGYSACAPDTFRWFEQAMERAMALDDRTGKATQWQRLRMAMRRSAIRGQDISDLRTVIQPMPGFAAIPASGDPDGMYCYSDHPLAQPPLSPGLDQGWLGYDFWSRASNGDIIGNVPNTPNVAQTQIGRGFSDEWRTATSYQDADQYLYVAVSASKKPVLADKEHFLVYVSSTMAYDENARWYADIGALSEFVATTGDVIEFFIPRSSFRLRSWDSSGNTVWGTELPAGTHIENFGISSEMSGAYQIRLRKMRLVATNTSAAVAGAKMPFFPGSMPFAINADLKLQQFVGWNGSPFHGYQLADFWWWLESEADLIHPDLTVSDLPIPDRSTGALTYPINALTAGGVTKSAHALLCEQQVMFLKHAQLQWEDDGGSLGPFAHTFVLNTAARSSLGNPTPHTWVYTNDDPNTRWVGYQARVVESLAMLIDLSKADARFEDVRDLAEELATNWLAWLNTTWPNLSGTPAGMPTDFDNPAKGPPETLYEEPHAAGIILRACLWLEKAGVGDPIINQALMLRCWNYLELMWRTTGEMAYTWSPKPAAKQWYGFWHGEILQTLAEMVRNTSLLPAGIPVSTVRLRMVQTTDFLSRYGVKLTNSGALNLLSDNYKGYPVLSDPPEEGNGLTYTYERLLDELDNETAVPIVNDTAERQFVKQQYDWIVCGKTEQRSLQALLWSLRGRFAAVWLPTFADDMTVIEDTPVDAAYITVKNSDYIEQGGVRPGKTELMIQMVDGSRLYRTVVAAANTVDGDEIIGVDVPFYEGLIAKNVMRVSFMNLCRLDQDTVDIEHLTDTAGVAKVSVTFRAAPDIRQAGSGF